ncbi:MAG: TIGR04086 family membrane protein [Candidatus Thermoplasmatota archaeon]|nr:TIGR04086 family membrane protein [Candidatus Thermoplasmatota archaeon]
MVEKKLENNGQDVGAGSFCATMPDNPVVYRNNTIESNLEWNRIIVGGVIAFVVSAILGFIMGLFFWDADSFTISVAIILVGMLSWFIGGLYAGIRVRKFGGTHGALAGATCAIISIPINIIFGMSIDIGSAIFAVLWAMLFAGLGGLIGYYATKSSKIQSQPSNQTLSG